MIGVGDCCTDPLIGSPVLLADAPHGPLERHPRWFYRVCVGGIVPAGRSRN